MEKCQQCDQDYSDHDGYDHSFGYCFLFKVTRVTADDSSGSVLFLVWKETMNEFRPGDLHLSPPVGDCLSTGLRH